MFQFPPCSKRFQPAGSQLASNQLRMHFVLTSLAAIVTFGMSVVIAQAGDPPAGQPKLDRQTELGLSLAKNLDVSVEIDDRDPTRVVSVLFSKSDQGDEDVANLLRYFPSVERVMIYCQVTDGVFDTLNSLPKLKRVSICCSSKITDHGFAKLYEKDLEYVQLGCESISTNSLRAIAGHKNIKSVLLSSKKIRDSDIEI